MAQNTIDRDPFKKASIENLLFYLADHAAPFVGRPLYICPHLATARPMLFREFLELTKQEEPTVCDLTLEGYLIEYANTKPNTDVSAYWVQWLPKQSFCDLFVPIDLADDPVPLPLKSTEIGRELGSQKT